MAELIAKAERIEKNPSVQLIVLWAVTVVLAVAFLALLVGDQVQAAAH